MNSTLLTIMAVLTVFSVPLLFIIGNYLAGLWATNTALLLVCLIVDELK